MIKIAPSVLSADFANIILELNEIKTADLLHIDVMDGHFVPNLTFGAPYIKSLRKYSNLIFDVHLMMTNPYKYIKDFVDAGADIITVHVECSDNVLDCLKLIKSLNKKCGIVINPDTDIKEVVPYLDYLDMILLMSVYPGFGGQKYIQSVTNKIEMIKQLTCGKNIDIEIDGGITKETVVNAVKAGANVIVAGTSIFGEKNREQAIKSLREISIKALEE